VSFLVRDINACLISRVSTLMETQDSSIQYQNDILADFILKQPNEHFNPDTDIFSDRVSGTKIDRKNSDFNKLMTLLGFKIIDTSKGDVIELSIKADKRIKPRYNKIYCKSTSRFARASFKSESLLDILKKRDIEVYFYDLQKSTFNMSDEELKIYSLIDSNYSKKMSYNWKSSNVYKTKNRKALLRGKFFGYDNIKINGEKYFKINDEEYKIIRKIVDLFLNEDLGCDLISQKVGLEKSFVNRILKNRHYLGQEKYYDYPEDYKNIFDSDNNREYLKNLNFKWLDCDYIEQIITEEEFNLIQEKLQSRTNETRGFRNPYLLITKKLVCGCCGKNYYSQGAKNMHKDGTSDRRFKCSSLRSGKGHFGIECNSKTFYECFLNNYLDRITESFKSRQIKTYKQNLDQLLFLRVHLVNLLSSNDDDNIENLLNEKEDIEEKISKLILEKVSLKSTTAQQAVDKLINGFDEEIKLIESKIDIYLNLKNRITNSIIIINELFEELQKGYLEIINKSSYTRDEVLDELKDITIYPKSSGTIYKKNSVYFTIHTYLEIEIFNLVKDIYQSEIKNILDTDIIKESVNKELKYFIIKEPTTEEITKANEILEVLGLI